MFHTFDGNADARVVIMEPNKDSTQHKRHPIMLSENKCTLKNDAWQTPRIEKIGAHQIMAPDKNGTAKNDILWKKPHSAKRWLRLICHGLSDF